MTEGGGSSHRKQRRRTMRSEEHTSELQSQSNLVCRLLLEKNSVIYVDGRRAASVVRYESLSLTEQLMDELTPCYNVLPQLDINNTTDHRPGAAAPRFLED